MSKLILPQGVQQQGYEVPKIIKATSYFIVEAATGRIVERMSTSGKRILRDEGLFEFPEDGNTRKTENRKLTNRDIDDGVKEGRFAVVTQDEVLKSLDRSKAGIGITGGGDCAGIADFLSAFQQGLNPGLMMLGVKNAGTGLMSSPDKFDETLIIVDGLAAKDFEGQSSTPFSSSRENPFPKKFSSDPAKRVKEDENQGKASENIQPFGFFYGTGGNDNLSLLERIATIFTDKVVVGTFKSIDGDGWIAGKPAQMLGFNTAVFEYQRAIWAAAQNAYTHNQWHVIETFGRGAGKLAYEAARKYPPNFDELPPEEQRKIKEFRDAMMILVPEKPTTLRSVAAEANAIRDREGNVVVVVAEGFMPPELKYEMDRLANDNLLKMRWLKSALPQDEFLKVFDKMKADGKVHAAIEAYKIEPLHIEDIPSLIRVVDRDDPRNELATVLHDKELAAHFAKTVWQSKLDKHGNAEKLAGISKFIMQSLEKIAGAKKVNQLLENYEARGATPTEYDRLMATKIGKKMAELVNQGVKGGKAVVYFEGMNPLTEDPVVVDLVGVSDKNNLNNQALYPTEILKENGVFWKQEDLGKYLIAA